MRTQSRSGCGPRSGPPSCPRVPGTSISSLRRRSTAAKGFAHAALDLLTEEVFATTLAVACSAVVSIRNEAAVRAYERAGFRWQRVWQDPLFGPCWLMLLERPPAR